LVDTHIPFYLQTYPLLVHVLKHITVDHRQYAEVDLLYPQSPMVSHDMYEGSVLFSSMSSLPSKNGTAFHVGFPHCTANKLNRLDLYSDPHHLQWCYFFYDWKPLPFMVRVQLSLLFSFWNG